MKKNIKKFVAPGVILVSLLGFGCVKAGDINVGSGSSGEAVKQLEVPAPSGWDIKGKFKDGDSYHFCSITSNTGIIQYWQIRYGGGVSPTFAIVKSRNSLDAVWSGLKIAPGKPDIDFAKYFLVVIQPGKSITQYHYNLHIYENRASIDFVLTEYHTSQENDWLMGQNAILAFKISRTDKTINIKIKKDPSSGGPYPK